MQDQVRHVLVTVPFFDEPTKAFLESRSCRVKFIDIPDGAIPVPDLVEALRGMQGWIVGHAKVTRELLEACPELAVIARRGVGYERVDVVAAQELGRVVTIASGGNAPSVADHTVGMMIAAGRRFHDSQRQMEAGVWKILVGTELCGKTVGLIGFGRIARLVARRLSGFEVRVISHSPRTTALDAASYGVSLVGLPELLRDSDYISLHAPLVDSTRSLIDDAALMAMKPTSILINTSRPGLVDETALLRALTRRQIAAAALDVFHCEVDESKISVAEQLLKLPNFVATPHSAGSTAEALARSNLLAAQSVVAVFDGGNPSNDCVVADGRLSRCT